MPEAKKAALQMQVDAFAELALFGGHGVHPAAWATL